MTTTRERAVDPEISYLLVCRECEPDQAPGAAVIPFGSAEERGKWAAAHTRGTGHQTWWVHDQPAKPIDRGPEK